MNVLFKKDALLLKRAANCERQNKHNLKAVLKNKCYNIIKIQNCIWEVMLEPTAVLRHICHRGSKAIKVAYI